MCHDNLRRIRLNSARLLTVTARDMQLTIQVFENLRKEKKFLLIR